MKMNHLIKKAAALLLAVAMLPISALAVTEDTVIDVPDVTLDTIDTAAATVSYLPDASYYADYGDYQPEWANSDEYVELPNDGEWFTTGDLMQEPWLTAGEQRRAVHLQEQYEKGEIAYTGESVLNKMTDVIVGVYALNPDDYDGETMFVLLPVCCLSDDMLLAIIDAFHQAGQPFDPAALNYRNCMRGGGIETTRVITSEENERSMLIHILIMKGMVTADYVHKKNAIIEPTLNTMYFNGLDSYRIQPYRCLTDEELAAWWLNRGAHPFDGNSMTMEAIERIGRDLIYSYTDVPFGMNLDMLDVQNRNVEFYGYVPSDWDPEWIDIQAIQYDVTSDVFYTRFKWKQSNDQGIAVVTFAGLDDGTFVPLTIEYNYDSFVVPGWSDYNYSEKSEHDWVTAADDWAKEHLKSIDTKGLEWTVINPEVFSDEGVCTFVMATTDEWIIRVMVYHNSLKIYNANLFRKAK